MQLALAQVALAALATAMAAALVGCERVGGFGPVAIQAEGSHLVVTVCQRIDVGEIHMQARPNAWGKLTTFWTDSSSISLDRGSSVSTGGPALSDTEVKSDPRLEPGTEISVLFVAEDPEADNIVGSFRVPPGGLPSDKWLQPDDSTTLEPCVD